jgi:hypothetical protein
MTPNLCHPQPSTAPRKRSSLVRDRRSRHYRKEGAAIGALVELTPSPQGSFFWHRFLQGMFECGIGAPQRK